MPYNQESQTFYSHLEMLPSLPIFESKPKETGPLPDMSIFRTGQKRICEDMTESGLYPVITKTSNAHLIEPPLKLPRISHQEDRVALPAPPFPSTFGSAATAMHSCTGRDCNYCASLTNLDIAAYYWSLIASRSYQDIKSRDSAGLFSLGALKSQSPLQQTIQPYSMKPPSPSGSLTSSIASFDSDGPRSPTESLLSESNASGTPATINPNNVESSVDRKFSCQVCHKIYSHPRLLNRHMQSHSAYKKHHCSQCGKGFNDAFDLKRHIRTHTGIKPFQCQLCEKAFTQRCSLEAHLTRVHNETNDFGFRERRPKIFVCEGCGETFQESAEFRMHEKKSGCNVHITK